MDTKTLEYKGYTFKAHDPLKVTTERQEAIFSTASESDWSVTHNDKIAFCEAIKDRSDNPKDVYHLASSLKDLLCEQLNSKPIIQAAVYCVLMDDEDMEKVDEDLNLKKLQLCDQYSEVRMFFFLHLMPFIAGLLNIESSSLTSDLSALKAKMKQELISLKSIKSSKY